MSTSEINRLVSALSTASRSELDSVIQAVAQHGSDAVPYLCDTIRKTKQCEAHLMALLRIGFPANAEAMPVLMEELEWFGYYPLTESEILSLFSQFGTAAIPLVLRALQDAPLNENLARGAGNILLSASLSKIEESAVRATLLAVLESAKGLDHGPYSKLLIVLGKVSTADSQASVAILLHYVVHGNDEDSQLAALEGLNCIDDRFLGDAKTALRSFLNDCSDSVRPSVEQLLRRLDE